MTLQSILLTLQRYSLKVTYRSGKELNIADALSPAFLDKQKENLLEKDVGVNMITLQLPISEEKLQKFKTATAADSKMQLLEDITLRGWLDERKSVPNEIHPYWTFRDEITYTD